MGIYSKYLFPRMMDWSMSDKRLAEYRKKLLEEARGRVLEIGIGTGLNLSHYGNEVTKLTGIDPNPGMQPILGKRVKNGFAFEIELSRGDAASMDFDNDTFNTVISTWTLCSVSSVQKVLNEIHRVLVPGGRFLFIEHGLSPHRSVKRIQNILTPVQKMVSDGCHLNRPVSALIESSPLELIRLETFYMEKTPRFGGYTYMGTAAKR